MGSSVKSLTKCKNEIDKLANQLNSYSKKIDEASNALITMMNGDGQSAYWEGQNAYDWYKNAIDALSRFCDNYKNSYREFSDLCKIYDRAYTKAKGKYTAKQWKLLKDRFDGSAYSNKVTAKDKESSKISAVYATVHADASNDDQTINAYRQYIALKNALMSLASYCDNMKTSWTNVKGNTTGKMSSDANARITSLVTRKKQITTTASNLEEYFIGDILFSN